ncbi:MAG: DUF5320 domain-containing protein, partial [Nanoarchaeota archaeon]|nr:DUF5320 domain-containing protein [Nanoarchaeota archaeon]
MPNRNKTGPNGDGPRTGRGLGDCLDKKVENSPRRGRGFGRGRGRCQRYWDNSDEEPRFGRGFG